MTLPTLGWFGAELGQKISAAPTHELRVCFDSRGLSIGDTFWAIQGARDGHEFVINALNNGALAAVVKSSFSSTESEVEKKLIRVADPLTTLTELARSWRKQLKARVIGLTGSVGKTTTKDFVRAALNDAERVFATEGNLNNEIGVPLTILRTPLEAEVLVCEMGAARIGDIEHLCTIADPNWGLITAISEAHTETFGSIDDVMIGKSELYRHVAKSGLAFVPLSDRRCVRASRDCVARVGYGFDQPTADWKYDYVQGKNLLFDEDACSHFDVHGTSIRLSIPGRPATQAALAAMTIALQQGVSPQTAAQNISNAVPTQGRVTIRKSGRVTIIDDSYNASPASMRSALETLSLRQSSRKIAVLGDMLELGEISDIAHREIVGELDHAGVSIAVLIGPIFSDVAAASLTQAQLRIYPSVDQALPTLSQLIKADDLVLVKASRGMALDRVVRKLEEQFG